MMLINNYTFINPRKNNDISLYLGLFEKSPTVLRKAIVTTPYSGPGMRSISNESPENLVLENIGQSERAGESDGEKTLLKNELGQSSHR